MGNLKFYKDEPLFGLDIGHSSLKAMQIDNQPGKGPVVLGYGINNFDSSSIQNGVIVKPELVAGAIHQLFEKGLTGAISSRRVACSLPTSHTFSRPINIPIMDHQAILEAVHLEAEQYIPVPLNNLYLDYEITRKDEAGMEVLLVAASKNMIDSYQTMLTSLALEPVAFEPSINAASRLVQLQAADQEPAIIVDIGSATTDIAVFDKTLLVSTAVNSGGDNITGAIAQNLHLTPEQASQLKNEFGIAFSDKQQRIFDAIKPQLEALIHEVDKSIRYHSERGAKSGHKISQIITVGGGSVMPGLNQYLSTELRLPTHSVDAWSKISFGKLAAPSEIDLAMYSIAAGNALINPATVLI